MFSELNTLYAVLHLTKVQICYLVFPPNAKVDVFMLAFIAVSIAHTVLDYFSRNRCRKYKILLNISHFRNRLIITFLIDF